MVPASKGSARHHSIPSQHAALAGLDEEDERALWMAMLQHTSVRSLAAVGVLTQEQEMLAMMLRRGDEDVGAAERAAAGLPLLACPILPDGKCTVRVCCLHGCKQHS